MPLRSLVSFFAFLWVLPKAASAAAPFEFALIGDYPYFPRENPGVPHLVEELREADLRFVLHLGDIHNPRSTPCSDALYRERKGWFTDIGHPFVLTPGDNDWADCDDAERSTYAQLEALREIFFPQPERVEGARGFAVASQATGSDYPEVVENRRWVMDGVVFATVHLVHPGFLPALEGETGTHKERLRDAGLAWIDETFAFAEANDARAVFLATQANLWFTSALPSFARLTNPDRLEVSELLEPVRTRLVDQVRRFGRPVVMANGDSHYFRIDKPLFDEAYDIVETFTRVEGFGSPNGHWVRVRVEPERPEVFSFRQEIVEENIFTLVPPHERSTEGADPGVASLVPIFAAIRGIRSALVWIGAATVLYGAFRGVRAVWRRIRRPGVTES